MVSILVVHSILRRFHHLGQEQLFTFFILILIILKMIIKCLLCHQSADRLELTLCRHVYCMSCIWPFIFLRHSCPLGRGQCTQCIAQIRWIYGNVCSICLEDNVEGAMITVCGHLFCRKCVMPYVLQKEKCPVCSTIMDNRHVTSIMQQL